MMLFGGKAPVIASQWCPGCSAATLKSIEGEQPWTMTKITLSTGMSAGGYVCVV
jgi:hypothetical protein